MSVSELLVEALLRHEIAGPYLSSAVSNFLGMWLRFFLFLKKQYMIKVFIPVKIFLDERMCEEVKSLGL